MKDKLNLSPIHEGYKWLKANPEHFGMLRFLYSRNSIEGHVPIATTPTTPKCGTTLCLAGAILLANAIQKGEKSVDISPLPSKVLDEVMQLLGEVNQWKLPPYPNMFPYADIRKGLDYIFMGDVFLDTDNEEYLHINHLLDIGLKDLKKELDLLYAWWEYVPEP